LCFIVSIGLIRVKNSYKAKHMSILLLHVNVRFHRILYCNKGNYKQSGLLKPVAKLNEVRINDMKQSDMC
jgi:hypothetical protein